MYRKKKFIPLSELCFCFLLSAFQIFDSSALADEIQLLSPSYSQLALMEQYEGLSQDLVSPDLTLIRIVAESNALLNFDILNERLDIWRNSPVKRLYLSDSGTPKPRAHTLSNKRKRTSDKNSESILTKRSKKTSEKPYTEQLSRDSGIASDLDSEPAHVPDTQEVSDQEEDYLIPGKQFKALHSLNKEFKEVAERLHQNSDGKDTAWSEVRDIALSGILVSFGRSNFEMNYDLIKWADDDNPMPESFPDQTLWSVIIALYESIENVSFYSHDVDFIFNENNSGQAAVVRNLFSAVYAYDEAVDNNYLYSSCSLAWMYIAAMSSKVFGLDFLDFLESDWTLKASKVSALEKKHYTPEKRSTIPKGFPVAVWNLMVRMNEIGWNKFFISSSEEGVGGNISRKDEIIYTAYEETLMELFATGNLFSAKPSEMNQVGMWLSKKTRRWKSVLIKGLKNKMKLSIKEGEQHPDRVKHESDS